MDSRESCRLAMSGESWRTDFKEWIKSEDLRIEATEVISTPAGVYMDRIYLIGANALYCKQGAFRFSFPDHDDILLREGELLVVFARRFVTIEALDEGQDNVLSFAIIAGNFANEYVSRLGFFNYFHAPCAYPKGSLLRLREILSRKDTSEGAAETEALCLFNSILRSAMEEIRMNGDSQFYDAIRLINQCVMDGKARVKTICDQMKVSRTQLHRIFVRNGFDSAGAFIKDTQLHYAIKLLRVSNFKIAEIARQLGFSSQSNFTAFIRQHTGKSPLQLRGKSLASRAS